MSEGAHGDIEQGIWHKGLRADCTDPRCKARMPNVYPCTQCGRDMGFEYILGPVCGKCCRENHARVTGRKGKR